MGFFSWQTADTEESIYNNLSDLGCKTVYLLQPNGQPPIKEDDYEGYGVFGGVDAYEWLARQNLTEEEIAEIENNFADTKLESKNFMFRTIGIGFEMGEYLKDTKTNKYYSIFMPVRLPSNDKSGIQINHIASRFDEPLEEFDGLTANEAIESGRLEKIQVKTPPYPLKFSFNKNAVYEKLPASKNCPDQGFFNNIGEDEDDDDYDNDYDDDDY